MTVGYYKREGQRPPVRWRLDADEKAPSMGFREKKFILMALLALFALENREIHETAGKYIYNPRPVVAHRS